MIKFMCRRPKLRKGFSSGPKGRGTVQLNQVSLHWARYSNLQPLQEYALSHKLQCGTRWPAQPRHITDRKVIDLHVAVTRPSACSPSTAEVEEARKQEEALKHQKAADEATQGRGAALHAALQQHRNEMLEAAMGIRNALQSARFQKYHASLTAAGWVLKLSWNCRHVLSWAAWLYLTASHMA